jgi:hypothetical protein
MNVFTSAAAAAAGNGLKVPSISVPKLPVPSPGGVLTKSPQAVFVRPTRSIGGIIMDVTVEENHTDELEITEHPVEQGAAVVDHAYVKPSTVTIKAGVSDASSKATAGDKRSVAVYNALLKLQGTREPFDLVTGKRVYKNMLIKSLAVVTDQTTENVLMVSAELQQIIIAHVVAVAVPRSRQKSRKTNATTDKGEQQAQPRKRTGLSQLLGRS